MRCLGLTVLAGLTVVIVGGCEVAPAEDASRVSAPPEPSRHVAASTSTANAPRVTLHRVCVAGQHLHPDAVAQRREQWEKVEMVANQARGDRGPQLAVTLEQGCQLARDFAATCKAWDPEVEAAAARVCAFAATGGVNAHWGCVAGQRLESTAVRAREAQWLSVLAVRRAKGWAPDAPDVTLGDACKTAREFATSCSAWDADVQAAATEVCKIAEDDCAPDYAPRDRQAAIPTVKGELDAQLRIDPHLESMAKPEDARKVYPDVKRRAKMLHCFDTASDAEARVEKWLAARDAAIADELKCRASNACMASRVAAQVCATIADKREALAQIAAERRNPGAVVDLSTLHDLGERVQSDDATIAQARARYASLAGHAFSEALCAKK